MSSLSGDVTHVIQLAVAPVFLLTAIATLINALNIRLGRGIKIQGVDGLMVRYAQCCQPVPGDPVTGYVTRGRGVSIHRADCPNLLLLGDEPERRLDIDWRYCKKAKALGIASGTARNVGHIGRRQRQPETTRQEVEAAAGGEGGAGGDDRDVRVEPGGQGRPHVDRRLVELGAAPVRLHPGDGAGRRIEQEGDVVGEAIEEPGGLGRLGPGDVAHRV